MGKGTLYTCDIFCLGVPSPGAFQSYLEFVEHTRGKKVANIRFRNKDFPWGVNIPRIEYEDGTFEQQTTLSESWKRTWSTCLLRDSCHACPYHSTQRPGDVSLGDFWGIENVCPDYIDDLGVSCVLVNNEQGGALLSGASHELELRPISLQDCANPKQPCLSKSRGRGKNEDAFWEAYAQGGFEAGAKAVGALGLKREAINFVRRLKKPANRVPRDSGSTVDKVADSQAKATTFPQPYAAKCNEPGVRNTSSSGGIFFELARTTVLKSGVVYGAALEGGGSAPHSLRKHADANEAAGIEIRPKQHEQRLQTNCSRPGSRKRCAVFRNTLPSSRCQEVLPAKQSRPIKWLRLPSLVPKRIKMLRMRCLRASVPHRRHYHETRRPRLPLPLTIKREVHQMPQVRKRVPV